MFTQLSVSMGSVSMRLTNHGLKTVEKNCIHSEPAHFPPVAVPAVLGVQGCAWLSLAFYEDCRNSNSYLDPLSHPPAPLKFLFFLLF